MTKACIACKRRLASRDSHSDKTWALATCSRMMQVDVLPRQRGSLRLQVPGASVHWYGKAEVARQRKVGHITVMAATHAEARAALALIDPAAARSLEATSPAAAPVAIATSSSEPPKVLHMIVYGTNCTPRLADKTS